MKEYIEREAAKKAYCIAMGFTSMRAAIAADCIFNNVPAADVSEVRHTNNIAKDYAACDQFVCEKCGIELQGWYRVERDVDGGDETHYEYVFRHCPNCGAKVNGGVNDG